MSDLTQPSDDALAVDQLTRDLRAWLTARPESRMVQASALAYETASAIALASAEIREAVTLLNVYRDIMEDQIRRFPIGEAHP